MTQPDFATREQRYLHRARVLSLLTRQNQLHFEGLSASEVSERLGVSRRTVMYYARFLRVVERKGRGGRRAT